MFPIFVVMYNFQKATKSHYGNVVILPDAAEAHPVKGRPILEQWRLTLEQCKITLEQCRITLEQCRITLEADTVVKASHPGVTQVPLESQKLILD
jgi:hypothetical protein